MENGSLCLASLLQEVIQALVDVIRGQCLREAQRCPYHGNQITCPIRYINNSSKFYESGSMTYISLGDLGGMSNLVDTPITFLFYIMQNRITIYTEHSTTPLLQLSWSTMSILIVPIEAHTSFTLVLLLHVYRERAKRSSIIGKFRTPSAFSKSSMKSSRGKVEFISDASAWKLKWYGVGIS